MASSRTGYCGETDADQKADCVAGDAGSVVMSAQQLEGWSSLAAACLDECRRCARCNFISISLRWGDCSWFHTCPADLKTATFGFVSGRVLRAH